MGITSWGAGNVAIRTGLNGVRVTDAPATGEVLTATSSTTADWEAGGGGGGGGGAVDSVDGQTGAVDLSGDYAPIAGTPVVRAFAFAYNTASILTGHAVYTPTIGDLLLDAWFEINTAWDGTTPQGDFNTFDGTGGGIFYNALPGSSAVDMTLADGHGFGAGLLAGNGSMTLSAAALLTAVVNSLEAASSPALSFKNANQLSQATRIVPLKFTNATPVKVCVSQTGLPSGVSPASTQGAAVLYLITATPA